MNGYRYKKGEKDVKRLVVAILAIAMVIGLVPVMSGEVEAASLYYDTHGDFPVAADGNGRSFSSSIVVGEGTSITALQGWTAVKNYNVLSYSWKYVYNGRTYSGDLKWSKRDDVRDHYIKKLGKKGYHSFTGYQLSDGKSISFSSVPANYTISLGIYAQAKAATTPGTEKKEFLVGIYYVTVRNGSGVVATAQNELNNWKKYYYSQDATATGYEKKKPGISKYFATARGAANEWSYWAKTYKKDNNVYIVYDENGNIVYEYIAWCAAFASYCLIQNGYESMLPSAGTWDRLNCYSMRQHWINNNRYVSNYSTTIDGKGTDRNQIWNNIKNKVKPGDLIFFISGDEKGTGLGYGEGYVSHHVGIVKSVNTSTKTITYIHGNSNKCNISESTMSINQLHNGMSGVYEILGFGLIHK